VAYSECCGSGPTLGENTNEIDYPKCSVKFTPTEDGQYKFVITNAGGANTVTFNVKVAK
jgi:hypothetical protein